MLSRISVLIVILRAAQTFKLLHPACKPLYGMSFIQGNDQRVLRFVHSFTCGLARDVGFPTNMIFMYKQFLKTLDSCLCISVHGSPSFSLEDVCLFVVVCFHSVHGFISLLGWNILILSLIIFRVSFLPNPFPYRYARVLDADMLPEIDLTFFRGLSRIL